MSKLLSLDEFRAKYCISLEDYVKALNKAAPKPIPDKEIKTIYTGFIDAKYRRYCNPIHPYSDPGWIFHPDVEDIN